MTTFNQQGQNVNNQYNAGRDIHFNPIQNRNELIEHMQQLSDALNQFITENKIDAEAGAKAKEALKNAAREASLPKVNKATLTGYLIIAKDILTGVSAAGGLVQGIIHLIQAIGGLFI